MYQGQFELDGRGVALNQFIYLGIKNFFKSNGEEYSFSFYRNFLQNRGKPGAALQTILSNLMSK